MERQSSSIRQEAFRRWMRSVFKAQNPIGASRGDLVVIQSGTAPVMKAVGVFYVLPLVLFFLGYWLGDVLLSRGANTQNR